MRKNKENCYVSLQNFPCNTCRDHLFVHFWTDIKKIGTVCQRLQTKSAVLPQGPIISIFLQGGIYLLLCKSWSDISATPLLLSSKHAAHKENEVWLLDLVSRSYLDLFWKITGSHEFLFIITPLE